MSGFGKSIFKISFLVYFYWFDYTSIICHNFVYFNNEQYRLYLWEPLLCDMQSFINYFSFLWYNTLRLRWLWLNVLNNLVLPLRVILPHKGPQWKQEFSLYCANPGAGNNGMFFLYILLNYLIIIINNYF